MIERGPIQRLTIPGSTPGSTVPVAAGGTGATTAAEATTNLHTIYTAGQSGLIASTTSAVETVLATVTLPVMGPNDAISVTALCGCTSSAATKTLRVRLGGASGTIYASPAVTTSQTFGLDRALIANRNNTALQVGRGMPATSFSMNGATGSSAITSSVDTSTGAATLVITGQSDGTDQLDLRFYAVTILRA